MEKESLRIEGLKKSYGAIPAVNDISFSVDKGSLFSFLGVNGAGKSTTINIVCSILQKDAGKVWIEGMDLDREAAKIKPCVGIVFQNSVLDALLTVKDNLTTRAGFYGLSGREWKRRYAELVSLLELEELVSRYGEITENSIIFQKSKNLTFADKYNALEENARARYDEFMAYILAKPDCRKSESSVGVTVKNKTDKMLSVTIKRGVVELNFMLTNSELNRLVRAEGIKDIKIKPVVIRLEDDTDLRLAKQTADITLEHLAEEQQYRKEKKKELRRKRNQEMRAAANKTL